LAKRASVPFATYFLPLPLFPEVTPIFSDLPQLPCFAINPNVGAIEPARANDRARYVIFFFIFLIPFLFEINRVILSYGAM